MNTVTDWLALAAGLVLITISTLAILAILVTGNAVPVWAAAGGELFGSALLAWAAVLYLGVHISQGK